MENLKLIDLIEKIKEYAPEGVEAVQKAYECAKNLHEGQKRDSGEPYIIHPLNVAYILAESHSDIDTICAGLLHDTLEDTPITKEDIAEKFNSTVANLVDGVTKIRGLDFVTNDVMDDDVKRKQKEAQNLANTRKIIAGITSDVRIINIKLADRLHNMRTIGFKKENKRRENALETMELFVPLAHSLGAYRIKTELEDLSFKQINPGKYKEIENIRNGVIKDNYGILESMSKDINELLRDNDLIPTEIKIRIKNIYGIYKRMQEEDRVSQIPDLLSLKIMLEDIKSCYVALGLIHGKYHPVNSRIKDFICNPKTNMYQSLHTTVFGPENRIVQTQIRTNDMDKVASFGLTEYWNQYNGNTREAMQECLKDKYQFYESLIEINNDFKDNKEFVDRVKEELFAHKVYIYSLDGTVFELPEGSTAIDFAYKIHTDVGNTMTHAIVNGKAVPPTYVLQNKDRVQIMTDVMAYGPRHEWENNAKTAYARRKIREFYKK